MDSVKRTYHVVWKEPNQEVKATLSLELQRMNEAEVKKHQQAEAEKLAARKKIADARKAKEDELPDMADRKAVVAALRSVEQNSGSGLTSPVLSLRISRSNDSGRFHQFCFCF